MMETQKPTATSGRPPGMVPLQSDSQFLALLFIWACMNSPELQQALYLLDSKKGTGHRDTVNRAAWLWDTLQKGGEFLIVEFDDRGVLKKGGGTIGFAVPFERHREVRPTREKERLAEKYSRYQKSPYANDLREIGHYLMHWTLATLDIGPTASPIFNYLSSIGLTAKLSLKGVEEKELKKLRKRLLSRKEAAMRYLAEQKPLPYYFKD